MKNSTLAVAEGDMENDMSKQKNAEDFIQECNFDEAMKLLKGKDDYVSTNLFNYARARKLWDKDIEESLHSLYFVDPNYNGVLSDEIKEFASGGNPNSCNRFEGPKVDMDQWTLFHKHQDTYYTNPIKNEPKIGMTKDEILNSTWGKPTDVNRTITKYGTSEQWVYSGNKYIYFEDGVVTAIQD